MANSLVIIPTYNEKENIAGMVKTISQLPVSFDIAVNLLIPKLSIACGSGATCAPLVPVPKAPVNENDSFVFWK